MPCPRRGLQLVGQSPRDSQEVRPPCSPRERCSAGRYSHHVWRKAAGPSPAWDRCFSREADGRAVVG
eukprot:7151896-Pyramimonas_sp.AAC.1